MNSKAWFFLGLAAVVAGCVSLLQGCDLATLVRVDVPEPVQEALARVWISTLYGAEWVGKRASNLIRR